MAYDFDVLPDDIWDSADPRAWQLLQLLWDGHDGYEAERIIAATSDDPEGVAADPKDPKVEEPR